MQHHRFGRGTWAWTWVAGTIGAGCLGLTGACIRDLGPGQSPAGADGAGASLGGAPAAGNGVAIDAGMARNGDAGALVSGAAGADTAGNAAQPDAGSVPTCVPPPGVFRLVGPISASTVTSARPRLRWTTGAGRTEAQICADRACSAALADFAADGTETTPPADLPPGYWYWRARPAFAAGSTGPASWTQPWLFRVRRRAPGYAPIANTFAEVFSDYNGDGYPDFAVQQQTAATIYFGGPGGVDAVTSVPLAPATESGLSYQGPGADMDGDGFSDLGSLMHVDVRGQGWPDNDALIRFGGGDGFPPSSRTAQIQVLTQYYPLWVGDPQGVGDFDGDGFGDMLMARRYGASLLRGCAPEPVPVEAGNLICTNCQLQQVGSGDFDGDGRSDLVFADGESIGVFRGNPGQVAPTTVLHQRSVAVLDYNGDGFSDLVAVDGPVLVDYPGGPGGLATTPYAVPLPLSSWLVGDFNGDGQWDVIVLGCVGGCPNGPTPSYVGYGSPGGWGSPFAFRALLDPALDALDRDMLEVSSAVVDLNADGYDDLLAGGRYYPGSPAGLSSSPIPIAGSQTTATASR